MYTLRLILVLLLLVQGASAAPVVLGSSKIEIPLPQGYVEVTPKIGVLWQLVQAAQGEKHILAFFIPEHEAANALERRPVNFERNINIQTSRKFEQATLTREVFEQVRVQLRAMVASKQVSAIQAIELERLNGNVERAFDYNPRFAQIQNVTLPAHVDLPEQFGFSEIAVQETTMPDGTLSRGRVTVTAITLLIKGKMLNCYATGGPNDLAWTRSAAKQWAEAIILANQN